MSVHLVCSVQSQLDMAQICSEISYRCFSKCTHWFHIGNIHVTATQNILIYNKHTFAHLKWMYLFADVFYKSEIMQTLFLVNDPNCVEMN